MSGYNGKLRRKLGRVASNFEVPLTCTGSAGRRGLVRWIVNWSIQFRAPVFFVSVLILLLGDARLSSSRVDVLPEFAPLFIKIQTEALGLFAPEVEDQITRNLEGLLSGTSWLRAIRSKSVPGLSSIYILCGLVTSTLFNLFTVPTLRQSFGGNPEPEMQFGDETLGSATT
jgi:multidrug efflux pump subunit AcrB